MTKYHIEFDTLDMPGRLKATFVTLGVDVVRDMHAKMNIALVDDPLYEKLERYVLGNPSRKRRSGGTET